MRNHRFYTGDDPKSLWSSSFWEKPYTSIWMVEYLLKKAGLSYEELLNDPDILQKTFKKKPFTFNNSNDFDEIAGLPGRCTSFAIQVVQRLERLKVKGKPYDFEFFQLGFHRVARCKETNIMIDSSSSCGAFILKEGGWDTFTGLAKWEWNPREERFEKMSTSGDSVPQEFSQTLTREQCLYNCLLDVANNLSSEATRAGILCYFRDTEFEARFFIMFRWDLINHKLQLGKSPKATEDHILAVDFQFDEKGDERTEELCRTMLNVYCSMAPDEDSGSIREQWETCEGPHERMWSAAIKEWGYPRLVAPRNVLKGEVDQGS